MIAARLAVAALVACAALPPAFAHDEPARPSERELYQRHGLPQSQFVGIGGETVHVVDEGAGPALILLHGSFASLREWDAWAARLKGEFRVVRYDASPSGLSGPHPAHDYSLDRRLATIDALADRLGIDRFTLVATSSSGLAAAAYAATRPERVAGVVLSNIATGPVKIDIEAYPPALRAAIAEGRTHPGFHRPELWRQVMLVNVENDAAINDALVTRWTELNNRPLVDPAIGKAAAAAFPFERTPSDLAAIAAPVLLLWSQADHETKLGEDGLRAFAALTTPDRQLIALGGCGHMITIDCPDRSLDAVLPFLRRVSAKPAP